ncbi:hypothetical protein PZB81_07320 [Staphylococcus epidermidis]|uniref:hypothetical protein n=1 Tax=Staphylococcus epidermidis TaxID=1282 RepID=UPI00026C0904|nr:hypothetical protein [Staphylococcus epidermidis]EJD80584.1 hypothetical protein HMPREF9995_05015 [Staphylococcus epidermidis NIHLM095]EJD83215.1 hypothetical protein HMPREF9993_03314 [Staphylococcus epidermidis NIHLM087]MCT1660386.1 hypothetical protein [Staphylococcus epidermidis]MDH9341210.1 hypothetical protein [Staphylococcus epidermidis]MDH9360390.1 hypothetical protein [Staphylococcus epidermidis]
MTEIRPLYFEDEHIYPQTHVQAIVGLNNATTEKNGLLSKEDKQKLDNLNGVGSSGLGSIFYKEVT